MFNQLKYALEYASILAMPNFNASFLVEIDANDVSVGVVLKQYDWPVAFISKVLNSVQ